MNFLSIYATYIMVFFKSRMEYKFSFFAGILANTYCYLVTYIGFWIIVENFGSIDGWDFNDISVLYGLNLLTYCIAGMFFWGIFGLEKEILSGDLDTYLIRPMGVIKQLICKKFVDTFIGQFIISILFLVIAIYNINSSMTFLKYVYLVVVIFSGVCMHAGAMIIFGSLSFWINRSLSLADVLYYDLRLFTQYPLTIFPKTIRVLLSTVLPWGFINYYPATLLLDKANSHHLFIMSILSPIIGILVFSFSLLFFHRGLRRYSSSGS